ncbi:MAG: M48 family metallopeptidase [Lachnospiraceae bacterium]|nr:M48 family metallopeptidase [Lachnospiraceae bacterium]
MEYQLIKSKRKSIAISFDRDGNLIVKAPYFVRNRDIDAFVRSKEDWIEATAIRLKREREKKERERLKLESGDILPLLGNQLLLSVIREDRSRAKITCVRERLLMYVPYDADYEYRQNTLEKWYRKEALAIISKKAAYYAEMLGVRYEDIHIKDQKSRWGSCSGKGNLNFNWRLIMAPEQVLDYVVIHELCHLRHMDHSREFWELVESICPFYKQLKKWLKEHGESLYFI